MGSCFISFFRQWMNRGVPFRWGFLTLGDRPDLGRMDFFLRGPKAQMGPGCSKRLGALRRIQKLVNPQDGSPIGNLWCIWPRDVRT